MATINSHKDLEVWQLAMTLAERLYELSKCFPPDERFGSTAQLRRSAISVPSSIAEGYGRNQTGGFLQFLRIAQGSLRELDAQVVLAVRLKLVPAEEASGRRIAATSVGKTLRALIRSLEART